MGETQESGCCSSSTLKIEDVYQIIDVSFEQKEEEDDAEACF